MPSGPGAAVHACAPGVVVDVDPLVVRTDDGCAYRYAGVRRTVGAGTRVVAGQAVAVVEAGRHAGEWGAACLRLSVTGADGRELDAYDLLAGLPDPAEFAPWTAAADPDQRVPSAGRAPGDGAEWDGAAAGAEAAGPEEAGYADVLTGRGRGDDRPGAVPERWSDDGARHAYDEEAEDEDDPAAAARAAALLLARPRPAGRTRPEGTGDAG